MRKFIPRVKELYVPILDFLSDGDVWETIRIREALRKEFFLSEEDAEKRSAPGRNSFFSNRVNLACATLSYAAMIRRIHRGVYEITPFGKETLESGIEIDEGVLLKVPSYQSYWMYSSRNRGGICSAGDENRSEEERCKEHYWEADPYELFEIPDNIKREYSTEADFELLTRVCRYDTRISNMIETGEYTLINGQLVSKMDLTVEKYQNGVAVPAKQKNIDRAED